MNDQTSSEQPDRAGSIRDGEYRPRATEAAPLTRRFVDSEDTPYRYFEPDGVIEPPPVREDRGLTVPRQDLGIAALLTIAVLGAVLTWNLLGGAVAAGAGPTGTGHLALVGATARPTPSATARATPTVAPTDTPLPARVAMDVNLNHDPRGVFLSEQQKTWCAASAVQMVLNVNGPRVDISPAFQKKVHLTELSLTTHADSRDGGVGPLGMVATLNQMGTVKYELRIYTTRAAAIRVTAKAITATGHPVIWMAWWGAHAWVVTGYRASADPTVFADATVSGIYVLDPWYPRNSSIWGPSDPPGTFQNAAEMKRNFPAWTRPEGRYPARDGKYLIIVPVGTPAT